MNSKRHLRQQARERASSASLPAYVLGVSAFLATVYKASQGASGDFVGSVFMAALTWIFVVFVVEEIYVHWWSKRSAKNLGN
jgi:hypothetical protein